MKMNGYYSEKSNDTSTSRVQIDVDKVKFKFIEAYSKPELEKEVDKFLAGDIKLVDWKFNSYDGYYMFTCTYQGAPSLDVGVTYREEGSDGKPIDKKPTSGN